jgi:hypothetical protein
MRNFKFLKYIALIFFCAFQINLYSDDCKTFDGSIGEIRKANYEISDVIFFGVITEIEGHVAKIKIKEQFKGNVESFVVLKFANDIRTEDIFSLWIIYGNKQIDSDTIFIDKCSASRCINGIVLPLIPEKKNNNIDRKKIGLIYEKIALFERHLLFFEEIEVLRIMREDK